MRSHRSGIRLGTVGCGYAGKYGKDPGSIFQPDISIDSFLIDTDGQSPYNTYGYFFKNITLADSRFHLKEKPVKSMREKALPVTAKVKLTLCTEDRFFGPGVCELLERIRETGSIRAAAAGMKLSYTKAWKILNRAEEELGTSLITRVSGGKNGGSSTLTPVGETAVKDFREMEGKLAVYADELLESYRYSFGTDERGG